MAIIKNYDYVVKNPDTSLKYNMKNIIAGFPGVGKSTAAEMKDWMFLDMESSNYHWMIDEKGDKVCNPAWPTNYVNAIIAASHDCTKPQLYILTSTHNEVLAEFDRLGLYYNAVLPKSKDVYIQRYRERGNSEEFIEKLESNFDAFIKSVESTNVFGIYYTDNYLYKIFVPDNRDAYPYSVLLEPNKDNLGHYEYKAENMPTMHTHKPIIVVADPSMVRDYKHLQHTSYGEYIKYIEACKSVNIEEATYIHFIISLANSINKDQKVVFVEATEEIIMDFCKNKLNFILAVPKTYVPGVHTYISARYGDTNSMFDAYIGLLKCYSFRTLVSDYYIDDIFNYVPNIDSICLIKTMDRIVGVTSSELAYDPDEEALIFREVIHEYLAYTDDDNSEEE